MSDFLNISKKMSYALRHGPHDFDFTMAKDGSVDIDDFCQALHVDKNIVEQIVDEDCKGRYELKDNRIWATQGHSFPVEIELKNLENIFIGYHGTQAKNIGSMRESGIISGSRMFVHISKNFETAVKVAERRPGKKVVLIINIEKMMNDGFELFESSNGVILVDNVPWEYIESIEIL